MCGIVGLVNREGVHGWQDRKEWLWRALFVDTLRGEDSTGLFAVSKDPDKDKFLYKKLLPGNDFVYMPKVESFLNVVDTYSVVIGHNRKATRGGISLKSAHPFTHGDITLVHNGTLISNKGLPTDVNFSVDSEAICHAINREGADKVLPILHGAFALTWYNNADKTFNMARNSERPLHFAFSKDGKIMFYASEAWMISGLMPMGIQIEEVYSLKVGAHVIISDGLKDLREYDVKNFEVYSPPKVTHMRDYHYDKWQDSDYRRRKNAEQYGYILGESVLFSANVFESYGSRSDLGKMVGVVDSSSTKDTVVGYNIHKKLFKKDGTGKYTGKVANCIYTASEGVTVIVTDVKELVRLVHMEPEDGGLEDTVIGPKGIAVTIKAFNDLTKNGCAHCTADVYEEEADELMWTPDNQPVCPECVVKYYSGV